MKEIRELLDRWAQSLCREVSVGGLISRCRIAHKWKAPYRTIVVREALLWRMHDLGQQIVLLAESNHILGSRILLRSAIETLCLLIYLNHKTQSVLSGTLPFLEFEEISKQLLIGSKNGATSLTAVNVLTVLKQADKVHPGLSEMHQHLSESAHPNFDGVLLSYTETDPKEFETRFLNNLKKFFGEEQEPAIALVFEIFESEYNIVWHQQMMQLEDWLRHNDAMLEAQRAGS